MNELPAAISVSLCKAMPSPPVRRATTEGFKDKPEDKFISLDISLLHFKIDARSAALRVDSWSSWTSILYVCVGEPALPAMTSVWTPTSEEKRGLFEGC